MYFRAHTLYSQDYNARYKELNLIIVRCLRSYGKCLIVKYESFILLSREFAVTPNIKIMIQMFRPKRVF